MGLHGLLHGYLYFLLFYIIYQNLFKKFEWNSLSIDSLLRVKSPGKTRNPEENVSRIKEAFQRSPLKSIHAAILPLQIPRSTLHDVLHKRLASPKSVR
jgi:hypothetical protein